MTLVIIQHILAINMFIIKTLLREQIKNEEKQH